MTYTLHTQYDSPNHNPGVIRLPARRVVLHWWGSPSGQDPYGVISWLCNPRSQVSAHAVIWPGNVACLAPYTARSWANGNDLANSTSITLECDPNNVVDTMPTIVEYLADLVRQNVLTADFELTGHKDWYATACPGAYYQWLPTIRRRVTEALTGTLAGTSATQQEEEDMPITDADIERIAKRTTQMMLEGHAIERPDHHRATLGQHIADIAQTCVALRDGDLPVIERPDGSHKAELGLVLGNIEQRVVSIDDRIGGAQ